MQLSTEGGMLDVLEDFHQHLDSHFRALCVERKALGSAPVFALEHALSDVNLDLLRTAVRESVKLGFGPRVRRWWLPFVVYAAESGYGYSGGEYWQSFTSQTPMWAHYGSRSVIRDWFEAFSNAYGGAVPRGAFAEHFRLIAWPITHAVLPTDLQQNLARLLHDFRTGLTEELLRDPEALGLRLASRAVGYSQRFRVFCENTTLLGHISAALLPNDGEDSPYLLTSTRDRIVEDLSRVRESKRFLATTRQTVSRIRARGFVSPGGTASTAAREQRRLPNPTDPKLVLKRVHGRWQAFVALPNLSVLSTRLPGIYDELNTQRVRMDGRAGPPLARTLLLRSGQEERLTAWPSSDVPLLQLVNGSPLANQLLAEQCVLTPGPVWLFRRGGSGPATEVRGRVVRPGLSYILVVREGSTIPATPWVSDVDIETTGVKAFELEVPNKVTRSDAEILTAAGVSIIADVAVQPVGVVASGWDGEGSIEWLAGEPAMLCITSQISVTTCVLTLDGQMTSVPWPEDDPRLFIVLEDLAAGTYELGVALLAADVSQTVEEKIVITILDPQVRPESASAGEGLRLLASPAPPSMTKLFEGQADLSVDGPPDAEVELVVALRGQGGEPLAEFKRRVTLPFTQDQWHAVAAKLRNTSKFEANYDEAESVSVAITRSGLGFAALTSDRGFRPLRWRIIHKHDNSFAAQLIDRTDSGATSVKLYLPEKPLLPISCSPQTDVEVPASGGLLVAISGDSEAAIILPTQPNVLIASGVKQPSLSVDSASPKGLLRVIEAHRNWGCADLPADAFAARQQMSVLGTITRTLIAQVCGGYWAKLESEIVNIDASQLIDHLDAMKAAVGVNAWHRDLADEIAHSLWEWKTDDALTAGFTEAIGPALHRTGGAIGAETGRFLLLLSSRPGDLAEWNPTERELLLDSVIKTPVLLRAARFAFLGASAYNYADEPK